MRFSSSTFAEELVGESLRSKVSGTGGDFKHVLAMDREGKMNEETHGQRPWRTQGIGEEPEGLEQHPLVGIALIYIYTCGSMEQKLMMGVEESSCWPEGQ